MSILITFQLFLFLLRMLHDKNFKKYTHGIPIKLSAENSPQGGRYHSGSSSPEVYYEKEFAQDEKKESRL